MCAPCGQTARKKLKNLLDYLLLYVQLFFGIHLVTYIIYQYRNFTAEHHAIALRAPAPAAGNEPL